MSKYSCMGRVIHSMLLCWSLCMAILNSSPCYAQIQLLGEHLVNPVTRELSAIGQTPLIYLPARENSPVLYFTPFFAFEENTDRSLKVEVDEPLLGEGPWKVRLTILMSPKPILDSMAAEVRKYAATHLDPKVKKYESVTGAALIPTELTYLVVAQADASAVFRPVIRTDISSQQPIHVEAEFPTKTAAEDVAKRLRNRNTRLRFKINYQLFARLTLSESSAKVTSVSLSETDAVKSLSGAGGAFNASVKVETGEISLGQNPPVITRTQADSFRALLKNEITSDYIVEKSEDMKAIDEKLQELLKTALVKEDVALDEIDKKLANMSAYSFSPLDLTPAKIKNLAIEAKNVLASDTADRSSFNAATSGSAYFGMFSGDLKANYSREELKKSMMDKGWKFGADTELYVPKSLEVHVVDVKKLNQSIAAQVTISRRLRKSQKFSADVTTDSGFFDSPQREIELITGRGILELIKDESVKYRRVLVRYRYDPKTPRSNSDKVKLSPDTSEGPHLLGEGRIVHEGEFYEFNRVGLIDLSSEGIAPGKILAVWVLPSENSWPGFFEGKVQRLTTRRTSEGVEVGSMLYPSNGNAAFDYHVVVHILHR